MSVDGCQRNIVASVQFDNDRFLRTLPVSSRREFSDHYLTCLVTPNPKATLAYAKVMKEVTQWYKRKKENKVSRPQDSVIVLGFRLKLLW